MTMAHASENTSKSTMWVDWIYISSRIYLKLPRVYLMLRETVLIVWSRCRDSGSHYDISSEMFQFWRTQADYAMLSLKHMTSVHCTSPGQVVACRSPSYVMNCRWKMPCCRSIYRTATQSLVTHPRECHVTAVTVSDWLFLTFKTIE